uniref:Uncharacterized protein n=1 Tax=Timema bartmani TaxID=61472 RepID=A0A7R9FBQ1_9NEOP|nr:unnamed protein product [Timema bartmani]
MDDSIGAEGEDVIFEKSELFKYLEDVGLSELVTVTDNLALTRDSPRQDKITTFFKRLREQLLTSLRWRTPVQQNDALFDKCVATILESMLMMREDSYHVEYITSRSTQLHDQCHWYNTYFQTTNIKTVIVKKPDRNPMDAMFLSIGITGNA